MKTPEGWRKLGVGEVVSDGDRFTRNDGASFNTTSCAGNAVNQYLDYDSWYITPIKPSKDEKEDKMDKFAIKCTNNYVFEMVEKMFLDAGWKWECCANRHKPRWDASFYYIGVWNLHHKEITWDNSVGIYFDNHTKLAISDFDKIEALINLKTDEIKIGDDVVKFTEYGIEVAGQVISKDMIKTINDARHMKIGGNFILIEGGGVRVGCKQVLIPNSVCDKIAEKLGI